MSSKLGVSALNSSRELRSADVKQMYRDILPKPKVSKTLSQRKGILMDKIKRPAPTGPGPQRSNAPFTPLHVSAFNLPSFNLPSNPTLQSVKSSVHHPSSPASSYMSYQSPGEQEVNYLNI